MRGVMSIGSGLALFIVLENDIWPLCRPPCHVTRPEVALPRARHIGSERARLDVFVHAKRLGEILPIEDQVGEFYTRVKATTDGRFERRAVECMRLFGQRQLLQGYGLLRDTDLKVSVCPVLQ